jgi:glycerophosphoryl diester phosphodiesterase
MRWAWGTISLPKLLREINFRAELFLDIKSSSGRAATAVLELYHDNEAMMPRTRVSSKKWKLLDRIGAAGTDMEMYYSVGQAAGINSLLRRCGAEHPPHGTSIRHTLLTPDVVRSLHSAKLQVYAWTVNTEDRMRELLDMGVDGIISDDPELLRRCENESLMRQARAQRVG